jgi:cell division protein FtsX
MNVNWFYALIGKIFFSRQQDWKQQKSAKTMTWVVVFSVVLALVLAKVMKLLYNHAR